MQLTKFLEVRKQIVAWHQLQTQTFPTLMTYSYCYPRQYTADCKLCTGRAGLHHIIRSCPLEHTTCTRCDHAAIPLNIATCKQWETALLTSDPGIQLCPGGHEHCRDPKAPGHYLRGPRPKPSRSFPLLPHLNIIISSLLLLHSKTQTTSTCFPVRVQSNLATTERTRCKICNLNENFIVLFKNCPKTLEKQSKPPVSTCTTDSITQPFNLY